MTPDSRAAERQPRLQDGERHEGKDHHSPNGLTGLHDGHGEPPFSQEPVVDCRHGRMVETGLKAQASTDP